MCVALRVVEATFASTSVLRTQQRRFGYMLLVQVLNCCEKADLLYLLD